MDTIFALSSGSPPAAIAIIRISGASARSALESLTDTIPEPRYATVRTLRGSVGEVLDEALVLWLPGPNTVTGEDLVELHCHGGRAVIVAIEAELAKMPGLRKAEAGEFTRRAFANGRIDLAEAEGLADLLSAETELQRQSALAMAGGAFSDQIREWRDTILHLSAQVEATLDFSDEEDISTLSDVFYAESTEFAATLREWLDRPRINKLQEGFRVVLAGPPNAGKSTLFNALLEDEAAITSATAGTTRDVLERSVSMAGIAFTFVDTAGLRSDSIDEIETIGIGRAQQQVKKADCILWLGSTDDLPAGAFQIQAKSDLSSGDPKSSARLKVSAVSGEGMEALRHYLIEEASRILPKPGDVALNARQSALIGKASAAIEDIQETSDLLIIGECLRNSRGAFDELIGNTATEQMLDALFGRFCIGK